ncbi:MAG: N-acetyltransferase [Verrucomicrobiaceae bacterium]|nr:MAG: N-acetyltransferase [Verrucomicrobiaceae bacterium]
MLTQAWIDEWSAETCERYGLSLLSVILRDGDLYLQMMSVYRGLEGQGRGTNALRALCGLADEYGYRIVLTAATGRLSAFYERHGFVPNTGPDRDRYLRSRMMRLPH